MNAKIFDEAKLKFTEGIKFFNEKKYELAEKNFLESLNLLPERLSTINNLIKIYVVTKNLEKLNEIIAKYKKFENEKEILFGKAFNLFFNKDFEKSIDICNKILIDENLRYPIQDLLASNYKKLGNFLEALKIYKKKVLENKNDYKVYYNIGCLLLELGKIGGLCFIFKE